MRHRSTKLLLIAVVNVVLFSCGGGGGGGGSGRSGGLASADFDCDGGCANLNLTVEDVRLILAQAQSGAVTLGTSATFAVVDRVGNVLAVYQMPGAASAARINGQIGAAGGLEGAAVPSTLAAISKAGTGAYLSSQGNAFSTRTASQIIQENFNPGELNQPGGPLFGVQFSQLPCSEVTQNIGPKPLPLGLSADPGGIPLYRNGDLIGGIGVELDGAYTLDRNIIDTDNNIEERIAMIASIGFEAPSQRVAPNMNVGKSLRYVDLDYSELEALPEVLPAIDDANVVAVSLFFSGTIRAGATFGDAGSGFAETIRAGQPAAILVNGSGGPRFPTTQGSSLGGAELTSSEVDAILDSALVTAFRDRAAIRRPLDTAARVSIWVVDNLGNPLGFIRSQDAPVFGTDVALQKARTAAFFSSSDAEARLDSVGLGGYARASTSFIGKNVFDGSVAFANRSIGNLARPFFVDGLNDNPNGPLSLPFPGRAAGSSWSPFNDGLQLDLVSNALLQPLVSGTVSNSCVPGLGRRLGNGIQIFPGSVPLYRGSTLIGAIGISGDGVDQDDFVAFYGASRKGLDFVGHTGIGDSVYGFNAPIEIRADNVEPVAVPGTRLRYVNCPPAPFIGSNEQNACDGL